MCAVRLDHLLEYLTGGGLLLGLLWLGLALLTVGLIALMLTRWGQSRSLRKCLAMSILAHLLLAGYSTTVRIVDATRQMADDAPLRVSLDDAPNPEPADKAYSEHPWETFSHERTLPTKTEPLPRETSSPDLAPQRTRPVDAVSLPDAAPVGALRPHHVPGREPGGLTEEVPWAPVGVGKAPEKIEAPTAQRREEKGPTVPDLPGRQREPVASKSRPAPKRARVPGLSAAMFKTPPPLPRITDDPDSPAPGGLIGPFSEIVSIPPRGKPAPAESVHASLVTGQGGNRSLPADAVRGPGRTSPPSLGGVVGKHRPELGPMAAWSAARGDVGPPPVAMRRPGEAPAGVPEIYKLRTAPNRAELAARQGANEETEQAVKAALKWLAENQDADGRWDASRHGAGRELLVSGRNRMGAGANADTSTTGLALLAFLAAGHTHLKGEHQQTVRRGLEFLLRSQSADGSLGGQAGTYAFMYAHAIAAFAMSEALAMSGDDRLREPVRRAVGYTLGAQDPKSGGWRYKPGDEGDTSQLGWQLMALKSAELGGIGIPRQTKLGAMRFLRDVSSGRAGGLAAYRVKQRQEPVTHSMTAEALVCRQFLGVPSSDPACREAGDFLLGRLPGQGDDNLYYWYYGTLGMYQLQGTYWRQWEPAMKKTLLARQVRHGPLAGTWNPDTRWDNYGGRVYSTALSSLCLEVYYRFLPLYMDASSNSEGGE